MRRKLLDLTKKNQLINFPIDRSTSSLRIVNELPDQLFSILKSTQVMRFAAVPKPTLSQLAPIESKTHDDEDFWDNDETTISPKMMPDAKTWAAKLGINTSYELPNSADIQTSKQNYLLIEQTRKIIDHYLECNNGSLDGIRQAEIDAGVDRQ
ncbi:DUF4011 domain-containing protein [Orbaceae bacterium ESL0727]|nr:DUF4011 domain-containing protein [Orbaceae bacterium ESL0727]